MTVNRKILKIIKDVKKMCGDLFKDKLQDINRSYYAIFHAIRAVLAFDNIDMKSHKGIILEFRRLYIKTKVFSNQISDIISVLFDVRTNSDYKDFYVISKKEVEEQLKSAKFFVKEIESF